MEKLVTPVDEFIETMIMRPQVQVWLSMYESGILDLDPRDRILQVAIKTYGQPTEGRHWLTGRYCIGLKTMPNIGRDY